MKSKFYFETRCGRKHPKWIKLLEQYFLFITSKSNESFTWITLWAEMNEELLAIKKRTGLNEKTNLVAEICEYEEECLIAIKRNQVTMAIIRFRGVREWKR